MPKYVRWNPYGFVSVQLQSHESPNERHVPKMTCGGISPFATPM